MPYFKSQVLHFPCPSSCKTQTCLESLHKQPCMHVMMLVAIFTLPPIYVTSALAASRRHLHRVRVPPLYCTIER
jgi:hypothetical protein